MRGVLQKDMAMLTSRLLFQSLDVNYGISNQYETPETDFDWPFRFDFGIGDQVGFLSGMSSYHDDGCEDRRFR